LAAITPTSSVSFLARSTRQAGDSRAVSAPPDGNRQGPVSASAAQSGGSSRKAGVTFAGKQDPQLQAAVAQLKSTEEKVKAHEAAHKAAGGAITGPVSFTYTRGPDGRNYITGGEVPITISAGRTPQETISRMQQVIQAALAPADPSPQDRAVAGQAAAQQQAARQKATEIAASGGSSDSAPATVGSKSVPSVDGGETNGGNRRTLPDKSTVERAQRAYRDQQVSGVADAVTPIMIPRKSSQPSAESLTAAVSSSMETMTPASITGFGTTSRPVSYYA
jgi:hypothetical protein